MTGPAGTSQDGTKNKARSVHVGQVAPHKSALQAFHCFCSKRDKALGVGVNPATRSYWDAVKREWAALTAAQKQEFNDLAALSAQAAASRKVAAQTSAATPCLPQALVTAEASAAAADAVVVADLEEDGSIAGMRVSHALMLQVAGRDCRPPAGASPLSPQVFDAGLRDARSMHAAKGINVAAAARESKLELCAKLFKHRVCGLAKAEGAIPEKVRSERMCMGLCVRRSAASVLNVAVQLDAAIASATKTHADLVPELRLGFAFQAPAISFAPRFRLVRLERGVQGRGDRRRHRHRVWAITTGVTEEVAGGGSEVAGGGSQGHWEGKSPEVVSR